MSISVVNGYLCTSCNDVTKAKKGENPHPPPGTNDSKDGKGSADGVSLQDGPAVTFGGTLSALSANPVDAVAETVRSSETSQRSKASVVDLLA